MRRLSMLSFERLRFIAGLPRGSFATCSSRRPREGLKRLFAEREEQYDLKHTPLGQGEGGCEALKTGHPMGSTWYVVVLPGGCAILVEGVFHGSLQRRWYSDDKGASGEFGRGRPAAHTAACQNGDKHQTGHSHRQQCCLAQDRPDINVTARDFSQRISPPTEVAEFCRKTGVRNLSA